MNNYKNNKITAWEVISNVLTLIVSIGGIVALILAIAVSK